ncbi:large conductance mechanosensitive channel protein MscL [soil metagenome]
MNGVVKEFRDFLFRGNVVDLAVAVVIGAAFGAVVSSLVSDLITPLIGMIVGKQDFSALKFTINSSEFMYGNFINTVITFVLTAAAIFFIIVKPMNIMLTRRKAGEVTSPSTKVCPECLSSIPLDAKRCAFCTSVLA